MKLWDAINELGQTANEWLIENYANLAAMAALIVAGMLIGYGIAWTQLEAVLDEIKILAQGG